MNELYYDLLVIGGGAAGSRAAYQAKKEYPNLSIAIAVIGKYDDGGSTNIIASEALGINAPYNFMNDNDNADIYYSDIISTGGGLADPHLCRIIADESKTAINTLIELGIQFDKIDGHIDQKLLSGCTKARSLTCGGSTGRAIVRVLKNAAVQMGVEILEDTRIIQLVKNQKNQICGALGLQGNNEVMIKTKAIVLATGGSSSIFKTNVTPDTQMGDGWAMAYDAGCKFTNMEFFQIGPALANPPIKFIIHSHMWKLKPKITNRFDQEFIQSYCDDGGSAEEALNLKAMSYPFSVRTDAKYVDIAIFKEIMAGRGTKNHGVYFDVTHMSKEELINRAPITYETLKNAGVDISKEKFEITLAVQNFNGGIVIDENGFTGIDGLYAAGEITGGIHGSDRPGGNNLTDSQVFGSRAGRCASRYVSENNVAQNTEEVNMPNLHETTDEQDLIKQSEKLFYNNLTIVRTKKGLEDVLQFIEQHENENLCRQLHNRFTVGKIMANAMLKRTESRGTHYRDDYKTINSEWLKRIVICKETGQSLNICYKNNNNL